MLNNQSSGKRSTFFITYFLFPAYRQAGLFLILLSSCSIQKQIAQSAKTDVLETKALQAAHVGISIFDPSTNKYLYNYQGDKYFVPASNTKIPTCYAAMKYLGDSLVGLKYNLTKEGVILFEGTGDPTFLNAEYKSQPVFEFLKQGIFFSIGTSGLFPIEPLGSGWSWNDYEEAYMAQRSSLPIYGNIMRIKWLKNDSVIVEPSFFRENIHWVGHPSNQGFDLKKSWDDNNVILNPGKTKYKELPFRPDSETVTGLLGDTLEKKILYNPNNEQINLSKIIHSQPTDSLLKPMMHRSDNFFAEQSLLMVSNELLGVMNDEKIIDTLLKTDFKDLPQKPRWADGSGLSRYNLFTPQDFVAILNKMKNEFGMERIKVILPTGGEGTISSYYKADSGYIYGKTGTLSGVVAFSGFLYTKKGKLLIFSTLVNNHQASATEVRRAIEKFLQGLRQSY
ncbi:MAG: D-alanyl-D-alanine carboxypeptidase [Chitinophagaceae bacterium]